MPHFEWFRHASSTMCIGDISYSGWVTRLKQNKSQYAWGTSPRGFLTRWWSFLSDCCPIHQEWYNYIRGKWSYAILNEELDTTTIDFVGTSSTDPYTYNYMIFMVDLLTTLPFSHFVTIQPYSYCTHPISPTRCGGTRSPQVATDLAFRGP
jgi:hypothetical protein